MLKIINKFLIRIKEVWLSTRRSQKRANFRGLSKNPLFFFGLISLSLFVGIYMSCDGASLSPNHMAFFNSSFNGPNGNSLFSSQSNAIPLETPDLKIMQDNTICAMSTPCVVSGKVLGDTFGGNNQIKKDVTDYVVQKGDTFKSIANSYNISLNTLLWANDLSSSSAVKVGQDLTILPVDGVLHVVKSGDTLSAIAAKYKAKVEDIISYNDLANQDDVYIGDILLIPGGVMPKKAVSSPVIINNQIPLANNYFISPVLQGHITQGLHYFNAIDIANPCGTPIYAAASGIVQRVYSDGGWHQGGGNFVTILHPNGTSTYYGHFETVFVVSGQHVTAGDRLGLTGRTGNATGCHVHFEVIGAWNFMSKFPVGAHIKCDATGCHITS